MRGHLRGFLLLFVMMFLFVIVDGAEVEAAVINPNQVYTYEQMETDIIKLAATYPELISYKIIGKSEYGRDIYAISLGKGGANVFINGSHHAREWMTTTLNMYMIDQYAMAYRNGSKINNYNARNILNKATIWFIPMVNPDGVSLQQYGLKPFPESVHQELIKMNGGSKDFKRWKANAKGVDLNRQYNANWANIKSNPGKPSYENYKGTQPHSASEVKAVLSLVAEIDPEVSVSYHSSGEILYWNFHQTGTWYQRDHGYAKQIGGMTGYSLVYPGTNPSGGGFTDWFIINYKRPAFTPEISRYYAETSPPLSEFTRVWNQNKAVGLYVANLGYSLNQARLSTVIKDADKKVGQANTKSSELRSFYSSNIKSEKDLFVTSAFSRVYQATNSSIRIAENALRSLSSKDYERLNLKLQEAYYNRDKAAAFIDSLTTSNKLSSQTVALKSVVDEGILNEGTVQAYHELSEEIRKTGILMGKMHGPHVRDLMSTKYVVPGKILKETIIYEITRYMLIEEIQALLSLENAELIEEKLAELGRLERRSVEIKAAGNKLYPGKYPDLPEFEKVLQQKKTELLKAYEQVLPNEEVNQKPDIPSTLELGEEGVSEPAAENLPEESLNIEEE